PPSSLRPGLNPMLDIICGKAMAKTPAERYSSMKAFAGALIEFLRSTPVTEGGGNLTPIEASPADVFQAATVAPTKPPPPVPAPPKEKPARHANGRRTPPLPPTSPGGDVSSPPSARRKARWPPVGPANRVWGRCRAPACNRRPGGHRHVGVFLGRIGSQGQGH